MKRNISRRGFTLVELSIVLVILGLLVGGVLAGQSLIKAAELRAVSTEYTNFHTALGTFKDKYFSIPGDMPNAVRYWGAQAGAETDGYNVTCAGLGADATGLPTCNGNGDGVIGSSAHTYTYEMHRGWQHLANAGMIEGRYTGIRNGTSGDSRDNRPGINMPRSKFATGGWTIISPDYWSGTTNQFAAQYGVTLILGAAAPAGYAYMPVLKPEEAYNIDMKMDDGKPHLGKIVTHKNALLPNCLPSTNDAYTLTYTAPACSLLFITGY